MNKKVKWIILSSGMVILAAFFLYTKMKPLNVEVVSVQYTEARMWFLEDGEVAVIDDYQIYAAVAGKVLDVYVMKDEYVEAGQIIALIDSRDYQHEIDMRNKTIEGYQTQKAELLATAGASAEQGQRDVEYYQELAEKYAQLYQDGIISKLEYDTQMQYYQTARSSLLQIQAGKDNGGEYYDTLIEIEQLAIENLQSNLEDCLIKAEKSGYITALPVAALSYAYPQTLLCTIKEGQEIIIESYVSTEDVVQLQIGSEVELIQKTSIVDFYYRGQVVAIADWAEESVSALGIIERRVKVTILPLEEITTLGSGYDIDVKFFTFVEEQCILLPNSAFYRFDGTDYVFVVDCNQGNTGKIKAVPVVKGAATNSEAVVVSGIEVDDFILKNSTGEGIVEGAKVSLKAVKGL